MILNSQRNAPDLYRLAASTLGLKPGAGQDEVRKAYRRAAQKFHPDQHVGEGKDELYSARFHLASAAKTLLLAKGSEGERKALEDFNKAKAYYEESMKKAGVSPASMGAGEAGPKAAEAPRAASGPQSRPDYTYGPGARTSGPRPQGPAEGKTADGQTWKRWSPPPFEEASAWNGSRQETRASSGSGFREADWSKAKRWSPPPFEESSTWSGARQQTRASQSAQGSPEPQPQPKRQEAPPKEDSRPFKEATRPFSAASDFFTADEPPPVSEAFKRSFESATSSTSAAPAPAPRATANQSPPASSAAPKTETAAPSAPPSNFRNAARAYEQAQSGPTPKSRLDTWA